jgi:hypothetical protein
MTSWQNSQLKFFSFGRYNVIALFCSTTQNKNFFDWCQLWDVTALTGPAGPYGEMTKDGRLMMAAESDRFFTDSIYAVANVLVGETANTCSWRTWPATSIAGLMDLPTTGSNTRR